MSGTPFVVAHVTEANTLDVLVRTDSAAVAYREVECSGPTAHLVCFGTRRAVNEACPRASLALIDRALFDGTHPALYPPVETPSLPTESDPATAPTLPPPPVEAPRAEPAFSPRLRLASPADAPRFAPVVEPAPVAPKAPRRPRAPRPAPAPVAAPLCSKCERAPVSMGDDGEPGLWCAPCRALVLQAFAGGKRGAR